MRKPVITDSDVCCKPKVQVQLWPVPEGTECLRFGQDPLRSRVRAFDAVWVAGEDPESV